MRTFFGTALSLVEYSPARNERLTFRSHALSRLLYLGRLLGIVPPRLQHAPSIARFGRGPAERIPIGDPVRRLVPVRDPVAAGADHPVQRPAGDGEFRPGTRRHDLFDQRVD